MVCEGIETITTTGFEGVLAYPTICDHYFYAKIMFAIWVILTFILYKQDEEKLIKGDLISSMGVSAIAVMVIATIGSLFNIIAQDILIEIFVIGVVILAIWFFRR